MISRYISSINSLNEKKNHNKAELVILEGIEKYPTNLELIYEHIVTLIYLNKFEEAIKKINSALSMSNSKQDSFCKENIPSNISTLIATDASPLEDKDREFIFKKTNVLRKEIIRKKAHHFSLISQNNLAAFFWGAYFSGTTETDDTSIDDILNYLDVLIYLSRFDEAETIIDTYKYKWKENYNIHYYHSVIKRKRKNHEDECKHLIKATELSLAFKKPYTKIKKIHIRLINNLLESNSTSDADSFVRRNLDNASNSEWKTWFKQLNEHLNDHKKRKSEIQERISSLPNVNKLIKDKNYHIAEENLKPIIQIKNANKSFASDLIGVAEMMRLKLELNNEKNQPASKEYIKLTESLDNLSDFLIKQDLQKEIIHIPASETLIESLSKSITSTKHLNLVGASTSWEILAKCFLGFGFFQAGLAARNFLVNSLIDELNDSPHNTSKIQKLVLGLLESGRYSEARNWFEKIKNEKLGFNFTNAIKIYTEENADLIYPQSESYKRFRDMIHGKSVAIVGPAPTDVEQGEEIDSYDFVVRTNFFEHGRLDSTHYGKRTNISYYASNKPKSHPYAISNIAKDLNCIIFKNNFNNKIYDNFFNRIRIQPPQFRGVANQLPIMLYDLLLSNPNKMKIFSMNFHYSKRPYNNNYDAAAESQRAGNMDCRPFICHDPFSSISLSRALRNNFNNITADKECEEVLKLTNEEYATGMQEIFRS